MVVTAILRGFFLRAGKEPETNFYTRFENTSVLNNIKIYVSLHVIRFVVAASALYDQQKYKFEVI